MALHRSYNVSNFSSVVVSGPIEAAVEIGQGCEVTADVNYKWLLNRLSVTANGKTLHVKIEGGINLRSKADMPRVKIVLEKLTGVEAASTASVTVVGSVPKLTRFTAGSSGVSTLRLPSIEADTIYLSAKDVSTLSVSGKAIKAMVDAHDMGTINGEELVCKTAYIGAEKMSNVRLTVSEFAAASAAEMSSINIIGPARVEKEADFMSSVSCEECD